VRLIAALRVTIPPPAPGLARVELNVMLRQVTAVVSMVYSLVLTAYAAEGLGAERDRDTLTGLLTTPLTGAEILGAKMLGALWRTRWVAGGFVVSWLVGLAAGAVHPVGFLAATGGLAVSSWFLLALGMYASVWSRDLRQAMNLSTLPAVLLTFSGILPLALPAGLKAGWAGSLSQPWQLGQALVSYEEVRDALGPGPYPTLQVLGIESGESAPAVAAALLLGWALQAAGAVWLTRAAFRGFDAAVGRPRRPRAETAAAAEIPTGAIPTAEVG
jgi:hypothetical protein